MIQLEHVSFIRGQRTILSEINLRMETSDHWAIIGRNGSGKTTVLELVNGYEFPSSGTVTVLGAKYGETDVREARKQIGYLSHTLYEKFVARDPVWEIVASGKFAYLRLYERLPQETIDEAGEKLEQLRIFHLKDQPLGTLSQGERKKVLLARILMQNPKLIVMDEPCAGLDLYEREKLLIDIQRIAETGKTQLIYVTHHMEEIIPVFSHAALMLEGRVYTSGPKEEVMAAENLRQIYGIPLSLKWENGRPWVRC